MATTTYTPLRLANSALSAVAGQPGDQYLNAIVYAATALAEEAYDSTPADNTLVAASIVRLCSMAAEARGL